MNKLRSIYNRAYRRFMFGKTACELLDELDEALRICRSRCIIPEQPTKEQP